jgi:hypothetical protein
MCANSAALGSAANHCVKAVENFGVVKRVRTVVELANQLEPIPKYGGAMRESARETGYGRRLCECEGAMDERESTKMHALVIVPQVVQLNFVGKELSVHQRHIVVEVSRHQHDAL